MVPSCCGKKMKVTTRGMKFLEVRCGECGDTVYIKKNEDYTPQLIDD